MAIYNSIALGKARKSAGNVRFSIWKGIPVASQKPTSVANPRTFGQLTARARLTVVVALFRLMPALIDAMYAYLAIKKSAYNAFMSKQNEAQYFDIDQSGFPSSIPANNFQITNQNIVLGSMSCAVLGGALVFTFTGLAISTSYSVLLGAGTQSGFYAEDTSRPVMVTTAGGGGTSSSVSIGNAISPIQAGFAVIQDVVTGKKFAYFYEI